AFHQRLCSKEIHALLSHQVRDTARRDRMPTCRPWTSPFKRCQEQSPPPGSPMALRSKQARPSPTFLVPSTSLVLLQQHCTIAKKPVKAKSWKSRCTTRF